jgi:integrase
MSDSKTLLKLTGMRSGELTKMRPCDIDRTREPWEYQVPETNRIVFLGPASQAILGPLLESARDAEKPLFSVV